MFFYFLIYFWSSLVEIKIFKWSKNKEMRAKINNLFPYHFERPLN
jgi:hypothetical protein